MTGSPAGGVPAGDADAGAVPVGAVPVGVVPVGGTAAEGAGETPGDALERALERYLQHLAVERGLAANTLAAYRRDLGRYAEHLRERTDPPVTTPEGIGTGHVRDFLRDLSAGSQDRAPLSTRRAARCLDAVRGAHRFWAIEGLTRTDGLGEMNGEEKKKD